MGRGYCGWKWSNDKPRWIALLFLLPVQSTGKSLAAGPYARLLRPVALNRLGLIACLVD